MLFCWFCCCSVSLCQGSAWGENLISCWIFYELVSFPEHVWWTSKSPSICSFYFSNVKKAGTDYLHPLDVALTSLGWNYGSQLLWLYFSYQNQKPLLRTPIFGRQHSYWLPWLWQNTQELCGSSLRVSCHRSKWERWIATITVWAENDQY